MRTEIWQRNLIALFIAHTIGVSSFFSVMPFLPLYVQNLGVIGAGEAIQWAGMISGAMSLSMAVGQPIWGSLADRFGQKSMVIRSMVGAVITLGLMGLCDSPEQLLIMGVIQGFVGGSIGPSSALIANSTPRNRLGFALGLIQVALFVGSSVGPLLGGVIADNLGYRIAFLVAAALASVPPVLVIFFVREEVSQLEVGTWKQGIVTGSRSLLAIATFPLLLAVVFLISFGAMIVNPVLSVYVAELTGGVNAATMSGAILAGTGVMSAVAALVLGRIADRVGHTKILLICLLGAAVSNFPQAMAGDIWQLAALRILLGFFLGGLMPTASALIGLMAPPERRGAAFGLVSTSRALAAGIAPLTGAAITTIWGMRAVFLVTAILFTLAFGWTSLESHRSGVPSRRPEADVD